jgi:hypothetical protein
MSVPITIVSTGRILEMTAVDAVEPERHEGAVPLGF